MYGIDILADLLLHLNSLFYSTKFKSYHIFTTQRIYSYWNLQHISSNSINDYLELIDFLFNLVLKGHKELIMFYGLKEDKINLNKTKLKENITNHLTNKIKLKEKDSFGLGEIIKYLNNINE